MNGAYIFYILFLCDFSGKASFVNFMHDQGSIKLSILSSRGNNGASPGTNIIIANQKSGVTNFFLLLC